MRTGATYTLEALDRQPPTRVAAFTRNDAARLGEIAVRIIHDWNLNLAVDIHIGDELAFRAQFGTTGQDNADVIEGKIRVVKRFGHSSLLARLKRDADGAIAEGLDDSYKFWGGSIPIFIGENLIGTISTSGEEDTVDHQAAEAALRRFVAAGDPS